RHPEDVALPEPILHRRVAHKEVDELERVLAVLGPLDELGAVDPTERALLGQLDLRHVLAGLFVYPVGEAEAGRLAYDGLAGSDGVSGDEIGAVADLKWLQLPQIVCRLLERGSRHRIDVRAGHAQGKAGQAEEIVPGALQDHLALRSIPKRLPRIGRRDLELVDVPANPKRGPHARVEQRLVRRE